MLFHLVPLPFIVIGNANMTYAFGQSMAGATLAALATYSFGPRAWLQTAGLFVVASVAFLSHVGIFPLLLRHHAVAVAAFYRLFGGADLRSAANRIALAGALAAVFSVIVYYGHFPESYSTLQRVRAQSDTARGIRTAAPPAQDAASGSTAAPQSRLRRRSRGVERLLRAAALEIDLVWMADRASGRCRCHRAVDHASAGPVDAARGRVRVWSTLGFVGFSATAPIEPRFQRYSEEFISRVNFAVMPVAVVLAARGAVWAWRLNLAMRAVAAGVLAAALIGAARVWLVWMRMTPVRGVEAPPLRDPALWRMLKGNTVSLIEDVSKGIVVAMKAKDADVLGTLRMLKTALTMREVEKGRGLEPAEELQVVASLVKQRRDSIEQFTKGNRPELAAKEAREIAILERFQPPAATADDIERGGRCRGRRDRRQPQPRTSARS